MSNEERETMNNEAQTTNEQIAAQWIEWIRRPHGEIKRPRLNEEGA